MLEPEEKRLQGAELAGACLLEIEKPDPDLRRKQAEELCRLIENASAQTTPLTRARAGDTLAALGDPRFKEYCFHSPLPSGEGAGVRVILPATSTLGFLCIPKGKFLMGSSEQDESAESNEKPQHELDLPYDYWIAKYPVTVAQWRAFVEASGYRNFSEDALRDPDNRPVRYVTWHDALAYCDWLEGVLKEQASKIEAQDEAASAFWGALASGKYRVTLPSEAEWEKAARGPIYIQQSKINNRIYPWGDIDPNKANTGETGIGTTTAVGCFPGGESPYGCLDMSGNVLEWTRTIWNDKFGYPYKLDDGREDLQQKDALRVLRGGSYFNRAVRARCAFRGRYDPVIRSGFGGFRVVVSPLFSR
jgi:formylglycine-generating enzyme required for sulfatase activity